MWNQVNEVLTALHQQPALPSETRKTGFEKVTERVTNFLRWLAVAMMLGLLVLVLVKATSDLSPFWADVAMFLAVGMMCLAALWILLDTLPIVVSLIFLSRQLFLIRQHESKHEFAQAVQLTQHGIMALTLALTWLEIRIERMKFGLVFLVGGSDKVAVLMLAGSAWTIWHNMPHDQPSWIQDGYLYASAFLGGLAIGGLLTNMIVKKLNYQKDLLTLAIALLEQEAG
jgi:hypothetical protein